MSINEVLSGARSWHVETTDVLAGLRSLPDGCVHCCVTSPPYWGLRNYGAEGQIGLEPTSDAFIEALANVFEEVRRVLRPDGVLFLNLGDSYSRSASKGGSGPNGKNETRWGYGAAQSSKQGTSDGAVGRADRPGTRATDISLDSKQLMGIPWRVVLALQAAGWYWRSTICWAKKSPMPESVTDRPTNSWEPIFLLAKSSKYFYDAEAVKEEQTNFNATGAQSTLRIDRVPKDRKPNGNDWPDSEAVGTRNQRNVWHLGPEPFAEAHFATFPTEIPRRCLLAGTSEKGCCAKCGAPRVRVTEKERKPTRTGANSKVNGTKSIIDRAHHDPEVVGNRDPQRHVTSTVTTGWKASCKCDAESMPCLVLDPFNGAATTGVVARRLGLRYIGFELNPEYAAMSRKRILDDAPLMNAIA